MTNRAPILQLALIVALVGVALLSGKAVGTEETNQLLLPVGAVIVFITMVNPFASLIIFLLGFMRVGSYEEIGIIQIATVSYTAFLFLIAFARYLWRRPWDRTVVRTVTLMFMLMAYLGVSIVIAQMNQIPFTDCFAITRAVSGSIPKSPCNAGPPHVESGNVRPLPELIPNLRYLTAPQLGMHH